LLASRLTDFQRSCVSHAAPLYLGGLQAGLLRELCGLWAAAVYQHDANAYLVQDCYLFQQGTRFIGVREQLATGLHDESLAFVETDVRRCVFKRGDYNVLIMRI
jgi:hypothetical protein